MFFNEQHHIAIISSDYEQAMHFYRDILGLQVVRENGRPDKGDRKIDFAFSGGELELFIKPDSPKRVSYPEARGLRHLCFKVEDIDAAVEHLKSHGVSCEPLRIDDYTGERATFFFDPDGLPLELHE